jgi:hypothetical protein
MMVARRILADAPLCWQRLRSTHHACRLPPALQVSESVPFNGTASFGRRDLRPGKQQATVRRVAGSVVVDMTWGAPMSGEPRHHPMS